MLSCRRNMKFLGIDWGKKYIGFAIADHQLLIATPIKSSVRSWKILKKDLYNIIHYYKINEIILGFPSIDGKRTKACNEIYSVQDLLKTHFRIPIHLQEELCSSIFANEITKGANHSYAAAIILQSYLDIFKS